MIHFTGMPLKVCVCVCVSAAYKTGNYVIIRDLELIAWFDAHKIYLCTRGIYCMCICVCLGLLVSLPDEMALYFPVIK